MRQPVQEKSKLKRSAKWCGIGALASLVSLFVPPIGPIGMCANDAQGIAAFSFLGLGAASLALLGVSKVRDKASDQQPH